MKREKQEQLVKEFPEFFDYLQEDQQIQTSDNPFQSVANLLDQKSVVMPMQFGFECSDGWYWLLYNTFETVHNYCKWNKKEFPKITQVKEKFGTLNIYHHGGDNMIDGMFWLAEHLSGYICETCGTNVNVGKTEGWIHTICESCHEKHSSAKNLPWKLKE